MGILSTLFGSSSAGAASGPHAQPAVKRNVWRSVFDPGSNPNIDRVGSNYYDTVSDPKAPSTWEMILKAEDFKRRSFSDIDRDKDGYVDAQELAAVIPPSMKAGVDASTLLKEARPATEGKLTRKEFSEVLDKYFLA